MTKRIKYYQNWPSMLNEFIVSRANSPFEWGTHDCCISACEMVLTLSGIDLAVDFRGYSTEEEAIQIMKHYGGIENIAMRGAKEYNAKRIEPPLAKRGDLVSIKQTRSQFSVSLAIVSLNPTLVLVPDDIGWEAHPITDARMAWRVGE